MVVVVGDVATVHRVFVIGCERNADVPPAELAMIMIPAFAIGPPSLEREMASLQVSLLPRQSPVVHLKIIAVLSGRDARNCAIRVRGHVDVKSSALAVGDEDRSSWDKNLARGHIAFDVAMADVHLGP